ncbi:phosphinothricin acetyltransferase [Opitutaceae bacterium EW11]|nr:phosphinothricin acetyltransferase [Opitutaceae bacterium EW11]
MTIRSATVEDAARICAIYNPYVQGTTVTFEEEPVAEAEMRRRIQDVTIYLPWLVLEDEGEIVGYAYATKWRARSAYRFSVESTVYLEQGRTGAGLGTRLYGELVAELRRRGLRTVIGGVAQPNPASVRLHEKLGFRKVALFEKVGYKFGQWLDVGYWQLHL